MLRPGPAVPIERPPTVDEAIELGARASSRETVTLDEATDDATFDTTLLLLVLHHIAGDGWSMVMVEELRCPDGLERVDQVKLAVLEKDGQISVIPMDAAGPAVEPRRARADPARRPARPADQRDRRRP